MTGIPNYKTNKSNIIEATYTLLIYFAAADVALRQSFRFMRRFIYLRTRVQINSSPDAWLCAQTIVNKTVCRVHMKEEY